MMHVSFCCYVHGGSHIFGQLLLIITRGCVQLTHPNQSFFLLPIRSSQLSSTLNLFFSLFCSLARQPFYLARISFLQSDIITLSSHCSERRLMPFEFDKIVCPNGISCLQCSVVLLCDELCVARVQESSTFFKNQSKNPEEGGCYSYRCSPFKHANATQRPDLNCHVFLKVLKRVCERRKKQSLFRDIPSALPPYLILVTPYVTVCVRGLSTPNLAIMRYL